MMRLIEMSDNNLMNDERADSDFLIIHALMLLKTLCFNLPSQSVCVGLFKLNVCCVELQISRGYKIKLK